MKRIQQGLATTLCIMTITFLITMPFILQTAADNWSDCDGNGNGYKHSFNACVAANAAAWDACGPYRACENLAWWKKMVFSINCDSYEDVCDGAWQVADAMCECDS